MSTNLVVFSGRLGKDPELKQTSGGKSVANFTLAVDAGYGNNKSTLWLNCEAWDKTAEAASRLLSKGKRALVQGSLKEETWEANGEKKFRMKVRVDRLEVIDFPEEKEANEISDDDIPF